MKKREFNSGSFNSTRKIREGSLLDLLQGITLTSHSRAALYATFPFVLFLKNNKTTIFPLKLSLWWKWFTNHANVTSLTTRTHNILLDFEREKEERRFHGFVFLSQHFFNFSCEVHHIVKVCVRWQGPHVNFQVSLWKCGEVCPHRKGVAHQ